MSDRDWMLHGYIRLPGKARGTRHLWEAALEDDEGYAPRRGAGPRVDGYGLELRFEIDGELRHSQRYTDWPALEQAPAERRKEFEERGWSGGPRLTPYLTPTHSVSQGHRRTQRMSGCQNRWQKHAMDAGNVASRSLNL